MKCAVQCDMEILFQTKEGNASVMKSEGEGAEKLDKVLRAWVHCTEGYREQEQTCLLDGLRPTHPWLCTFLVLKF